MLKMKVFKKPYIYWLIGIFIIYLLLNILISGFYNTIPLIIIYAKTVNWLKIGFSIFLTLIIGALTSLTLVLSFIKYKERKQCKAGASMSGAGALGGFIVGVCPLCVTGLFPLILSLIGISFSFASLPFQGLEIQVLVIVILLFSLILLNK